MMSNRPVPPQSPCSRTRFSRLPHSSFARLSPEEIATHFRIRTYGFFQLPDAIRPSYDLQIIPQEGFRHEKMASGNQPVWILSVSAHRLMDVFEELLIPLGEEVHVILESTHRQKRFKKPREFHRDEIDMPVLRSLLWDFETFLIGDGCTGISVLNEANHQEIRLDEHKILYLYTHSLEPFLPTLKKYRVPHNPQLRILPEGEHVHISRLAYEEEFHRLKNLLAMDETWIND
ncbi:MAG: hypothetical protein Q4D62_12600 [Planctomycetia bacterium]|nr:hypothetical protein [Planctomycetia bacterium]